MGLKPALRQTRSFEKDTNPEVTVVSLEFEFYSPLGLCPLWVCVLHCATLIKACKGLKPGIWYAQWLADSNPMGLKPGFESSGFVSLPTILTNNNVIT